MALHCTPAPRRHGARCGATPPPVEGSSPHHRRHTAGPTTPGHTVHVMISLDQPSLFTTPSAPRHAMKPTPLLLHPTNLTHSTRPHRTTPHRTKPYQIARQGTTLHSTSLPGGPQASRAGDITAVPSLDQPNPTHLDTRPPRDETTESEATRPDITHHETAFPPSAQSVPMSLQTRTSHVNAVLRSA
jgi:hypothetical protein